MIDQSLMAIMGVVGGQSDEEMIRLAEGCWQACEGGVAARSVYAMQTSEHTGCGGC